MKLKIVNEIENPKEKEQLGLTVFKKVKQLLESDPYDILKIKKDLSLKSKIEQKNNDIVKLINLLEKGKYKLDNTNKELAIKKSENEKLFTILKTELGIL